MTCPYPGCPGSWVGEMACGGCENEVSMEKENFKCIRCGAPKGECDCWWWCDICHRFHEKGKLCTWEEMASEMADNLVRGMRRLYPEPMRHASGGFAKTLRVNASRMARELVLDVLERCA